MKIFIARPGSRSEFYRLEKPLEYQNKSVFEYKDGKKELVQETYSANTGQVEIDLPEEEIEKIAKTTSDFFYLQEYLAFKYHGIKND